MDRRLIVSVQTRAGWILASLFIGKHCICLSITSCQIAGHLRNKAWMCALWTRWQSLTQHEVPLSPCFDRNRKRAWSWSPPLYYSTRFLCPSKSTSPRLFSLYTACYWLIESGMPRAFIGYQRESQQRELKANYIVGV